MKNRGFTLLEITVVVSIIIILATIFIANYRAGEKNYALTRSAHQLAQDLRRVQEMAMGGRDFEGVFPKGGYGIHLEENRTFYYLFADCNDNQEFEETGSPFIGCAQSTVEEPRPETTEKISFEKGIIISALSPSAGDGTLEILFFPPDPTVTINPSALTAIITLTNGEIEKLITINSAGLINVQ